MNTIRAIKLILTLRCAQSTLLISQSLDGRLSRSERIALRFHFFICRSCRRFTQQTMLLRDLLRQREIADPVGAVSSDTALSPAARARIRENLPVFPDQDFS